MKLRLTSILFLFAAAAIAQQKGPDLRSALDTTCKPCEDFFKYVNQKWIDANPIPADYARWGSFDKLAKDNRERLKTILDAQVADFKAGKVAKNSNGEKLSLLYTSCMDTEAIDKRGYDPIKPELARIAAIQDPTALQAEILHLSETGRGSVAFLSVGQDFKNSSQ